MNASSAIKRIAGMLITLIILVGLACGEFVDLGSTKMYLDMAMVPDPFVQDATIAREAHFSTAGSLNCNVCKVLIGHQGDVRIEQHVFDQEVKVSLDDLRRFAGSTGLIPAGWEVDTKEIVVNKKPGIRFNLTAPDAGRSYAAAWSPDEREGKGACIMLMWMDIRRNCTTALLESIRFLPKRG
jgi:hypothetical protein